MKGSFLAWLNAPSEQASDGVPVLTNLAVYIHDSRPDLVAAWPTLEGQARVQYARWFLHNAQFQYGLDEEFFGLIAESFRQWTEAMNPFKDVSHFDNGVAIRPLLGDLYLCLPAEETRRWPNPARTDAEDSFFAWLNSPSDRLGDPEPILTNLAVHIYDVRPDLRAKCPTLEGTSRIDFIRWFLKYAQPDYELDEVFIRPVAESFRNWAVAPAEPHGKRGLPVVTNLGAYLHSIRPDLQSLYPDLYGRHRIDFANWFIHSAPEEYEVGREQILPVVLSWAEDTLAPKELPSWGNPTEAIPQEMLECR